jgi:hypothetical protein
VKYTSIPKKLIIYYDNLAIFMLSFAIENTYNLNTTNKFLLKTLTNLEIFYKTDDLYF